MVDETRLLGLIRRPHEQHIGGEDRPPGRQLPHLGEGTWIEGCEGPVDPGGQRAGDRGEIHDRGRHHAAAGHDVGPEHRQIEGGFGEEHAMKDLQASPQTGRFEMELAQAPAAVHLIADKELLAIEAAADRLQGRIDRQGLQARQAITAAPDPPSKGIHQRMDAPGHPGGCHLGAGSWVSRGTGWGIRCHRGAAASRMAILTPAHALPLPLLRPVAPRAGATEPQGACERSRTGES